MKTLQNALSRVHSLVEKTGTHVLHTRNLSRSDREILLKHRWLEEIIRGWYLVIRPDLQPGDSTAWFSCFWEFLQVYLEHHYGNKYCLSAECSLDLYTGVSVIPKQVIVMALKGSGTSLQLPYETSILVYSDPTRIPAERTILRGLQAMPLEYALCKVSPSYFRTSPQEASFALLSLRDPNTLLRVIVQHNFKSAAGRLIGAYRALENIKIADDLKNGLKEIGMRVEEENPFEVTIPIFGTEAFVSPLVARIRTMWKSFREVVILYFPEPPGEPRDKNAYLRLIAERYSQDAYNSLSIEGYKVTEELIAKVKKAQWNPDNNQEDKERYNAIAARGYYEAHLLVKESVSKILDGEVSGKVIAEDMQKWYQRMFSPLVSSGILAASDLFGYRRNQVYIRCSRHTPPSHEYVRECMEAFFELLQKEPHAGVRAVLGHFIFVYIHPFMDGNGRIARFLMNAMLASGGYPWTIIHVKNRTVYMQALETASVEQDILPFTQFILSELLFGQKA